MIRRATLILVAACAVLLLGACGVPATPAPSLPPTEVRPSRVPVEWPTEVVAAPPVGGQPVAVEPSATPTRPRPTATATSVPPTPTLALPTETPTPEVTRTPDPVIGETLFNTHLNGDEAIPTCVSCHVIDPSTPKEEAIAKIGPVLVAYEGQPGVASRARTRVASQTAATYLRMSILNPNDFFVPDEAGRAPYAVAGQSLMFQTYKDHLSEEQLRDLIAYLLTLR